MIPKDFVPGEGITKEHIRNMVAKMGKTLDTFNLAVAERKIRSWKKDLRAAGKKQMAIWFRIGALGQKLSLADGEDQRSIRTIQDLQKVFASDGSLENCIRIWNVIIGQFERKKDEKPFKKFESIYLEKRKWKYSELGSDESKRSGFVEKLIKLIRREKQKLVNIAGSQSHGNTIGTRRPTEMITEKTNT